MPSSQSTPTQVSYPKMLADICSNGSIIAPSRLFSGYTLKKQIHIYGSCAYHPAKNGLVRLKASQTALKSSAMHFEVYASAVIGWSLRPWPRMSYLTCSIL